MVELRHRLLAARRRAGAGEPPRATAAPGRPRFDTRRADTAAAWRKHLDTITVDDAVERAADGLRHRALPLADQAVLRRRTRARSGRRRRSVRVRHLHDVGHLQDPAAAAHRAVARPGRRAGQRAAVTSCEEEGNLPIGYRMARGRRPVLPPGQRAGPHVPRRPLRSSACPGIDWDWALVPHAQRPAPQLRRGLPARRASPTRSRHTLDLAFGYHCTAAGRPPRRRPRAGRPARRRWPRRWVERVRPGDRPADRLDLLRGRPLELLVPAAARHGGADRAGRRRRRVRRPCSTASSATAPTR